VLQLHSVNDEPRRLRERHAMSWCLWGIYCLEWFVSEALHFATPADVLPKALYRSLWLQETGSQTKDRQAVARAGFSSATPRLYRLLVVPVSHVYQIPAVDASRDQGVRCPALRVG
jgi:hypothetical protein